MNTTAKTAEMHLIPFDDEPKSNVVKALYIHDNEFELGQLQIETIALNQAARIFHAKSIQKIHVLEVIMCQKVRGWAVIVEYVAG